MAATDNDSLGLLCAANLKLLSRFNELTCEYNKQYLELGGKAWGLCANGGLAAPSRSQAKKAPGEGSPSIRLEQYVADSGDIIQLTSVANSHFLSEAQGALATWQTESATAVSRIDQGPFAALAGECYRNFVNGVANFAAVK